MVGASAFSVVVVVVVAAVAARSTRAFSALGGPRAYQDSLERHLMEWRDLARQCENELASAVDGAMESSMAANAARDEVKALQRQVIDASLTVTAARREVGLLKAELVALRSLLEQKR